MKIIEIENTLFLDVRVLIEQSRQRVAVSFDAEITALYWNVGRRLKNTKWRMGKIFRLV